MDYMETLNARREIVRKRKENGELILRQHTTDDLDWSRPEDNKRYIGQLVGDKALSKADACSAISAGLKRQKIEKTLGCYPKTPVEFGHAFVRLNKIDVTYRGDLTMTGRDSYNILDMMRGARLMAGDLSLDFSVGAINDGVEEVYAEIRDGQLDRVKSIIEPRADFDWSRLVFGCFDLRSTSEEFVTAVLKKFVWQVKRKIWALPVTYHLMPVIRGLQGKGKSHFVKVLCGCLAELMAITDFEQVADNRNIDLWRSFVIFLDEMSKAAKADMETTKSIITADSIERRPMRTNNTVRVRQCGVFIGTTNVSLAELIKDETGIRRFVELEFAEPVFGFMDEFDFKLAWQSVHHTDADPMADFAADLARYQADWRNAGPVETWMRENPMVEWKAIDEASGNEPIATQTLFDSYLRHRQLVNGGQEREHRTKKMFAHELGRLVTSSDEFPLEKYRTARANGWRIKEQSTPMRVIDGGGL